MATPKTIQLVSYTPEQFETLLKESVTAVLQRWTPPIKSQSNLPEYLTRQQTANLLQISLVTLNDWCKRGVLQSKRIQGRVRFERAEVESALKDIKNLRYKRK
ncbi:hypothetical protein GCM10027275_30860 [Rhabdobacter roseus]|uniref:helix-turn-helix domain-containing protein n=1 Tax=Rhabdobacter roseus TaxID=1655419 RepID=UPI00161EF3B3